MADQEYQTFGGGTAASSQPYQNSGAYQQIAQGYKDFLGREGSYSEIMSHLGNGQFMTPQSVNYALNNIRNSAEAQSNLARRSQQRQTGEAEQPQAQNNAPPPAGSPVTANGQIAPQQAQTNSSIPQPTQLPAPPKPGGQQDDLRYVQGVDLSKIPAYQAYQYSLNLPDAYKPGELPPSYIADLLAQFQGPDQSGDNAQQSALIRAILANPQTMNPQVVAQLKERAKADQLSMQQQMQQQLDSTANARGTLAGGAAMGASRQLGLDMVNNIINSNRDTDIQAASTNRQDELNALQASEALLSGQLGRSVLGYNTQLGGQMAQAGLNRDAASMALQRAIAGEQNKQYAFDSAFRNSNLDFERQRAQAAENQYANSDAVSRLLQQYGINAGVAQNAQQNYNQDIAKSQIPFGQNMQIAELLEHIRQFNTTMGYNYDQLDQNGQNSLLQLLLSSGAM